MYKDRFISRDAASFIHSFMAMLPTGGVWPRSPDSTLYKTVSGLMTGVASWMARVSVFLNRESFPPNSLELLPDWEQALGLPEPCFPAVQSTEARQLQVLEKLARRPGEASRAYFIAIAARLGYQISITEYKPFLAGLSQCGSAQWMLAPHSMRYVWRVHVPDPRLHWFHMGAGGGKAGFDPQLRITRAEDLECILNKLKPAHTKLIFDYQGA